MAKNRRIVAYGFGWRHVMAILAFFGFFVTYMLRVNMNVALVAMVNQTAVQKEHHGPIIAASACASLKSNSSSLEKTEMKYVEGPYVWNEREQAKILASFFYGYVLTQLPGGLISDRIGGKWVLGLGLLVTSVMTLLTPAAANLGVGYLMILRIIEGMAEGVLFPAMHSMFGKWVPPLERSRIPAIVYTGPYVGTVATFGISGFIAASSSGWPAIFYVSGGIGIAWCILWLALVSNSPKDHPWISDAEFEYIDSSIESEHSNRKQVRKLSDIPWGSMAKSMPLAAICVCHFCSNWGFYTLLNFLPTYFRTILGFDIRANGLLSALPYLGAAVVQIVVSQVADFVRERQYCSTTAVRKFCEFSENFLQGLCLLCITFVGCDRTSIIILLFLGVCFRSICISGYNVNHLDIAPAYSGILMGISNFFANITGFATPAVVAMFTSENAGWNSVFLVTTALTWFAAVFYAVFGSGAVQYWAKEDAESEEFPESDKSELLNSKLL